MARPREKVILFIVEGTSDMHALERPIMNLLQAHESEYKVRFLPATTDITSDFRNNPDNILDVIAKHYFRPFFSGNDCYAKYVVEVVHLCDLDGTFIPPPRTVALMIPSIQQRRALFTIPSIFTEERQKKSLTVIEERQRTLSSYLER